MIYHVVSLPVFRSRFQNRLAWLLLVLFGFAPLSRALLSSAAAQVSTQIGTVDVRLAALPQMPPTSTPWTIGYSSALRESPDAVIPVEIHFVEPARIDLVVLMPATYTDDQSILHPLGFPKRFLIERILTNGQSEIVADYRDHDYHIMGTEPQLFRCSEAEMTTGIRITSTRLSKLNIWWRLPYAFVLSEVYAFAGEWNAALNGSVMTPDSRGFGYVWSPACLTDGFVFYSPVDRKISSSLDEFHSYADGVVLDYDLGSVRHLNEMRLWPVVYCLQENFSPAGGTSFPVNIRLEKLERPDDPAPQLLYQSNPRFPRPGSSPFMHRIPVAEGRYFRLTLQDSWPDFRIDRRSRIALAEVELFDHGRVLTSGKKARVQFLSREPGGMEHSEKLADGWTNAGEILPLRRWLEQFQTRAILERQRAALKTKLEFARGRDRERARMFAVVAVVLIGGLMLLVWVVRLLAQRRWARMREQIACDLHDEVGANLNSIAHSTEMVQEMIADATPMQSELLDDAIQTARQTAQETRQFIRILENRDSGMEIAGHIRKTAQQILGKIEYTCVLNDVRGFNLMNPARKWDLLFFIKEALNNVVKHAGARRVEISTSRRGPRLQLVIADDGCGIASERLPLRHLESRARRLKGELNIKTAQGRGTCIELSLTTRSS